MNTEYMPTGGVKELIKTAEGRRYLSRLQKKHELEILQPSDPRFKKVYGDKLKNIQIANEKKERLAKDEWMENKEKRLYEQRR